MRQILHYRCRCHRGWCWGRLWFTSNDSWDVVLQSARRIRVGVTHLRLTVNRFNKLSVIADCVSIDRFPHRIGPKFDKFLMIIIRVRHPGQCRSQIPLPDHSQKLTIHLRHEIHESLTTLQAKNRMAKRVPNLLEADGRCCNAGVLESDVTKM